MTEIDDIMTRFSHWPEHARAELINIAREIDAELNRDVYVPTPEELEGIDCGLADLAAGRVVGFDAIERLLDRYRPK